MKSLSAIHWACSNTHFLNISKQCCRIERNTLKKEVTTSNSYQLSAERISGAIKLSIQLQVRENMALLTKILKSYVINYSGIAVHYLKHIVPMMTWNRTYGL